MGVGGQSHAPAASTPGKDPVPIVHEAGWAPGPAGRAENLVSTGIRSRTVQPVVSRYIDWATRPTIIQIYIIYNHVYTLHIMTTLCYT